MSSLSFSFRFYCIIQFSRYNLRLSAAFCLEPLSACMAYVVLVKITLSLNKLIACLVGSSGLEPPTSRLSGVRSNHLSYEPV